MAAAILKLDFVHERGAENCCLRQLKNLLALIEVICPSGHRVRIEPRIRQVVLFPFVARNQSVICAELVIDSAAELCVGSGIEDCVALIDDV